MYHSSLSFFASSIRFVTTEFNVVAFSDVITDSPVSASSAFLAIFATLPPRFATFLLSLSPCGSSFLEISFIDVSDY